MVPAEALRGFTFLLFAALVRSGLEAVSLGGVFVFLKCLADPTSPQISFPLDIVLSLPTEDEARRFFLAKIGGAVTLLFVLNILLGTVVSWIDHCFHLRIREALSVRLLAAYLRMPYSWFLERNRAVLSKEVLSHSILGGLIKPIVVIILNLIRTLVMLGVLFFLEPWATLGALVLTVGSYGAIHYFCRDFLHELARMAHKADGGRFRTAHEALDGIKAIKTLGREDSFLQRFEEQSHQQVVAQTKSWWVTGLPGSFLQLLSFAGLLLLAVGMLLSGKGLDTILPMLGVFAMVGQRVMPAFKLVSDKFARLQMSYPALDEYYNAISATRPSEPSSKIVPLERELVLKGVCFRYPARTEPALKDINLVLPRGTSLGLVGATGAGKTTLVDVVLGLLTPQEGCLEVDGVTISESNLSGWRHNVGYVPQDIFLIDDTVEANIALGLDKAAVDRDAVVRAARLARIHDFILGELPDEYETVVGDKGVRLSGGQRQRIGIARALYTDPDILVFDEATSALDGGTESAVMESIRELASVKTLLVIAHRLSTVEHCDNLCLLESGRVTALGSFQQLLDTSESFRAMAQPNSLSVSSGQP